MGLSGGLGALGPPGGAIGPSVPKSDDLGVQEPSGVAGGMTNGKSVKGNQGKTSGTSDNSKGVKGKGKGNQDNGSGKGGMMMMMKMKKMTMMMMRGDMKKKKKQPGTTSPTALAGGTGAPTANIVTSVPTIAAAPTKASGTDVPTLGFATSAPTSAIVASRTPHSRATAAPSAKGVKTPTKAGANSTLAPTKAGTKTTLAPTTAGAGLRWNITLDLSAVPAASQNLFYAARLKWESIVVKHIGEFNITPDYKGLSNCTNLPYTVSDMYICAVVEPIDGPNNILGFGQPQIVRPGSLIPVTGYMKFDSADIGDSVIAKTILHEMNHAIGYIDSLWTLKGLMNQATPPCTYKAASNASLQYQMLSKCPASTSFPIEQTGGPGTYCTHPAKWCFEDELMTGWISGNSPISTVTIGALADIGYTVDYTMGDPYTSANMNKTCVCGRRREQETESKPKISNDRVPLSHRKTARPELSAEGRKKAIEFGQSLLRIQNERKQNYRGSLTFVGHLFVSVAYAENGNVFFLTVHPDS